MSETATIESPVKTEDKPQMETARIVFDKLNLAAREQEAAKAAALDVRRGEQEREEKARDKSGRFASKKAEVEPEKAAPKVKTEHPKAETDGKGRTEEPDRGADATAKNSERSEKALTALRRAKVPKAVLAGLSPEDRDQWGSELAEIQANTDRLTKEHPDLKKQIEALQKQIEQSTAKKIETQAASDTDAKSSADLDEILERATFGDAEARQALREALEQNAKPLATTIEAQKAEIEAQKLALKEQAEATMAMRMEMLLTSARTELRDRFPKLRTTDGSKAVLARMERLSADATTYASIEDPYERMRECMEDACAIEFKDDLMADERSRAEETDRRRLGGQMSSPGRASVLSDMKGRDRGEQIYWLMATEGLTGEEARKRVDGLK